MTTRFSPAWHRGDGATFARVVGTAPASPVDHDDPVHRERINRYERNIMYYLQAQYESINEKAIENDDFLALRVNYTGIAARAPEQKADWLYGDPLGINAIGLNDEGLPLEGDDDEGEDTLIRRVKDRTNQIRKHNDSHFWDWVEAIMGIVCGDFFLLVDAQADDVHPTISLLDPSYVFPDYPDNNDLPMRACQIQYIVDREGDAVDEDSLDSIRITEDYRLEIIGDELGYDEETGEMEHLSDEELEEIYREAEEKGSPPPELTCIYRYFEDDEEILDKQRNIGIPAIPIVHGRNSQLWNTRYGTDEVSKLIPRIEKMNETMFYAERIGRLNAHAKLALSGVRKDDNPLQSDFDDVIYLPPQGSASVLSLPTDISVLTFVVDRLEREMHRDAHIPFISQGEAEGGFGSTPSGLALLIRFGPLQSITKRHHVTYGKGKSDVYTLCLMFDEMVIEGQEFGSIWDYDHWEFKFDWCDAMPKALNEIIQDMSTATAGVGPLLSLRSARERIPGIDPDQEEERLTEQTKQLSQESLDNAPSQPPPPEEEEELPQLDLPGFNFDPNAAPTNGSG